MDPGDDIIGEYGVQCLQDKWHGSGLNICVVGHDLAHIKLLTFGFEQELNVMPNI
jgi:hypothetical protein